MGLALGDGLAGDVGFGGRGLLGSPLDNKFLVARGRTDDADWGGSVAGGGVALAGGGCCFSRGLKRVRQTGAAGWSGAGVFLRGAVAGVPRAVAFLMPAVFSLRVLVD